MAGRFIRRSLCAICFVLFFYAEVYAQAGDPLKAAFTFTPSKICDSATVQFTDQSTPKDSIISWLWNFGDPKSGVNNYSLVPNPSHRYDHSGTYIIMLTVADLTGNVSTAEGSVTVGVRPQAIIGVASPACLNRSVQFIDSSVSSSQITSWKWFFGVPGNPNNISYAQNPTHTYDQSGVFIIHLVITDSAACIDTGERTITVHDNPVVHLALSSNSICPQAGDTVQVETSPSGGVLSGAGISNDMILGSALIPNTIDTIHYFFIDSFQCYGSDTQYLKVNKLPVLSVSPDTLICQGDTIRLHAIGGVTYAWTGDNNIINSNGANPLVFPNNTVRYVVNAADANNCTAKDSVLITVYKKEDVKISADTAICKGSTVRLHASGAFSYDWQPKSLLDSSNSSSPLAFPLATTLFILTANKGTHCEVNDSTTISVHQKPNLTVSSDTSLCSGDTVMLSVSGAAFYQWSPATFLINAQSSHPSAFPDISTTFMVTGSDSIGCSSIDSIHVKVIYGPKANAGSDASVCFGDTIQLHGSGGKYLLWQPSNEVSNDTSANPFAFPKTTTDFVLTVSNGACSGRDTVRITVNPLPAVSAGNDRNFCPGDTTQLHASGASSYQWHPGTFLNDSTLADPVAKITEATSFVVIGTDVNGCMNKDTIMLIPAHPLNASAISDTFACAGSSVQLFAEGGESYTWYPATYLNDAHIANPLATPPSNITYHVIVSDGICYSDTLVVNVLVDAPFVNAGSDLTIAPGASVPVSIIASSGNVLWQPSAGLSCDTCRQVLVAPDSSVNYLITLTDFFNCTARDTLHVFVSGGSPNCTLSDIFVPNTFTPNGNGKNDVFYARTSSTYTLNYLRVFNRWGKMIFESKDWGQGWDGTSGNNPMPAGAYVYEMEAVCSSGDIIRKQGTITLIR